MNPLVFELLIFTAISCLSSKKRDTIYNPKPSKLSLETIQELIPFNFQNEFHTYFKNLTKDEEIVKLFNLDFYYFLKFTVITNNTNLIPSKISKITNIFSEKEPENIFDGVFQFDIKYNNTIEKEFTNIPLYYLFHGSSSSNWYSILRNGIKNCSNTSLMANGAAYGSGIYLSNSFNFSKGYSRDGNIIGVCQLKNPITQYMKTSNTYVVENEKDIILRHIIIANNNKNISDIEKYYMKELPSEYSFSQKNIAKINNKRLIKEIEHIEKYKKIENKFIKDIMIDSYIAIHLTLCIRLITCNHNINLVFILRDYPLSPPIIYLENICIDNIKFLNNRIYIDKMVIPSCHNIKTKLVDIINSIICIIGENTSNITFKESNVETIISEYDNYINKNKLFIT